jgi:hypothetical protein
MAFSIEDAYLCVSLTEPFDGDGVSQLVATIITQQPLRVETMQRAVFTIGHSTHTLERFIALLALHGITAVVDVRSKPYAARIRSSTGKP